MKTNLLLNKRTACITRPLKRQMPFRTNFGTMENARLTFVFVRESFWAWNSCKIPFLMACGKWGEDTLPVTTETMRQYVVVLSDYNKMSCVRVQKLGKKGFVLTWLVYKRGAFVRKISHFPLFFSLISCFALLLRDLQR